MKVIECAFFYLYNRPEAHHYGDLHMMNLIVRLVSVFSGILILHQVVNAAELKAPDFKHSVTTERKPWTDKKFQNNPANFQFAIVADRTGGVRRGIFPEAVKKVNDLRPEFVMSVGDLITGGSRQKNEAIIINQWKEFNSFIKGFDMPFFYLAGNHDVSNEVGDRVWDKLYGVRYYSFIYKNVLFLCLNAQEGPGWRPPSLGEKQIQWINGELKKHNEVRWTMVFLHQPLWLMEEGILIRRE